MDLNNSSIWAEAGIGEDIINLSAEEIRQRTSMLSNYLRVMKSDINSLDNEIRKLNAEIKENEEKVKMSKQLPYLVGNVVEILNVNPDDLDDDTIGSAMDLDDKRTNKAAVVKTSTRQTVYLPIPGLVDVEELKPGDLIGTNKDSYLILEKLPAE
jgi:26S proteasome regulatory subunit T5